MNYREIDRALAFKLPEFKGKIFGVFHTMNAHDRATSNDSKLKYLLRKIIANPKAIPMAAGMAISNIKKSFNGLHSCPHSNGSHIRAITGIH